MSTVLEASQLPLPKHISSLLYDPLSTSLALRHSDSSFSLYSPFSPLSLSSFPPPTSNVPSPTSSAAFLHLRTSRTPTTTLFITSSPLSSATSLRFYILRDGRFLKIKAISNHRDLASDLNNSAVIFKVNHGVSMKLSAGINVFSLYSVSNSKIWVFAVSLIGDEDNGHALKLVKCAVIDCCLPVFTIRVLFGFLILGEENGVRVFPLQQLVKGNQRKEKKNIGRKYNLKNGGDVSKANSGVKTGDSDVLPSKGEKNEKHSDSVKLRSLKLKQVSRDIGSFFVAFEDKDIGNSISIKRTGRTVKAISIQALSSNYFAVLDTVGDVHHLCLSYSLEGLDRPCFMKRLTQTMKVLKLAVFHDISTVSQIIWMSDGCYSVHLMMVSDMNTSLDKTEKKDAIGKLSQTSVTRAIFPGEKIQDIVPLAANAILILGQGSVFAYAIS
ncbi:hypothetical protein ACS0TY_030192 [Phlomoides rotata]